MAVVVVTDSSATLDPQSVATLGIKVVPLHVLIDGSELHEGVDEIPADYLSGNKVTTSGASPGELLTAFTAAHEASGGDGVLGVFISRKLSATWEAARAAESEFDGRLRIVDSQSAAMGVGFPALAAARRAASGATLDDAYAAAVSVTWRARSFVVVDRLDHLRRGGRISATAALLGTALAMKPVLHMVDGRLVPKEKTRTASKALATLVDSVVADAGPGSAAVAVQHIGAAEKAADVATQLRERIPKLTELAIAEFSPTLGVHLGPGAVGVVVVPGGIE